MTEAERRRIEIIFNKGWDCCVAGGCRANCPYDYNIQQKLYAEWLSGFDAACLECGDPDDGIPSRRQKND